MKAIFRILGTAAAVAATGAAIVIMDKSVSYTHLTLPTTERV